MMRAGFKAVLEAAGDIEVVAEASNGEEAVRAATEHRPDVECSKVYANAPSGSSASASCSLSALWRTSVCESLKSSTTSSLTT